MVLLEASCLDVRKKPHVPKVYIFIHIRIELRPPEDSSAVVVKSRVDLFNNQLRPRQYRASRDDKRKSRRAQAWHSGSRVRWGGNRGSIRSDHDAGLQVSHLGHSQRMRPEELQR